MPAEYVKIDDLRKIQRDLKKANLELAAELRATLKQAAGQVASVAKQIAGADGLEDTGALIKSIKAGMQGSSAVVRVTAKRNGFNYPAVYEYGRFSPWQETKGVRAFLAPALEEERAWIEADVLDDIDRILRKLQRG